MNSSGKCQFMSVSSLPLSLVQFCHLSLCWQATAYPRTYSQLLGIAPLPVLFQLGSMSAASVRSALCRLETHLWSTAPESSNAGTLRKRSSEWRLFKENCVRQRPLKDSSSSASKIRETPQMMMMMLLQPYVLMLNRHCNFLFGCAQRMLRRDAVYIELVTWNFFVLLYF